MLGAPVIEREEPVSHLALARDGAGDACPQVQRVAQFLLGDPVRALLVTRSSSAPMSVPASSARRS
jgi:hypothetical protein